MIVCAIEDGTAIEDGADAVGGMMESVKKSRLQGG